jgi:hypothetical protein
MEGGPVSQGFPVDATGLVMETPLCQPSTVVVVRASHTVGGERGAVSQRDVRVQPAWTELSKGTLLVELDESAQSLRVGSNLDCAAERELHADLRLEPVDVGGPPRTARVAVPGAWSLPRDLDCGLYQMSAALMDSTGSSQAQVSQVVLPGPGVALEPLPQNGMKAVCGQGASVPLSALAMPTPGFCQTPDYTWTYESGLEIEQVSSPDGTVELTTKNKELDTLIGGSVRIGVEASKGPARTAVSLEVPITVDPFVRVERRTELPAAAETGLVGVLVHLTNTTACDVSGVSYVEHLEGLVYVDGSAKLDGESVEARWEDNALQVEGVLLAGGATRTLSYVARPHLVGERRMWGEARKGQVLLSPSDPSEPPPPGCGCTSAGSGPMLFALAAMALRRRRR